MKNKLLKSAATLLTAVLTISATQVCAFFLHQPKAPENLNKFSKIK